MSRFRLVRDFSGSPFEMFQPVILVVLPSRSILLLGGGSFKGIFLRQR